MAKTGLELQFARSQEYRPILLWSTLVGMAAAVVTPFLLSSDSARELGLSRVGLLGAIVLPLVGCMAVGRAIYWLLVRRWRRDARVEA